MPADAPLPAAKKKRPNKLNDLDSKTWLKFQKSWFIHNPPPRRKDVLTHPAKFPETLAAEFICFFTKKGQTVLDPMVGTGSTVVACLRSGRRGVGIELNPRYYAIAQQIVADEMKTLGKVGKRVQPLLFNADAAGAAALPKVPQAHYVFTSPPYWDMLRARGAETQKKRRTTPGLDVFYSDDPHDLGNVDNYDDFVGRLTGIYAALKPMLRPKAYLTIIVKNVKKGGKIYPLAWDLARELGKVYTLKDERIWMQDNQRLAPYGLGNAWVSNTFHHYCLQFRFDP
ncbi:MAG: DNA methyltransferase [Anaerolineales bacterium]